MFLVKQSAYLPSSTIVRLFLSPFQEIFLLRSCSTSAPDRLIAKIRSNQHCQFYNTFAIIMMSVINKTLTKYLLIILILANYDDNISLSCLTGFRWNWAKATQRVS